MAIFGYILILIGLYLVVTRFYYLATNKQSFVAMGWVMWSIPLVIGIIMLYYGYGLAFPPVAPVAIMGGRRRWY